MRSVPNGVDAVRETVPLAPAFSVDLCHNFLYSCQSVIGWMLYVQCLLSNYWEWIAFGLIYIKNESRMYRSDCFSKVDQATDVYSAVLR